MSKNIQAVKVVTLSAVFMCLLASTFYLYEFYLRVAPSVITGELMQDFGISNSALGGLIAYYYFAYVPAQLPAGLMMDHFGPKKVLTFACFLCVIGTLMFISDSLTLAKCGRFLVGFGSAFAYVGVLKVATWLPRKYFALIAGISSALGMAGAVAGQILMNQLVKIFAWKNTLLYSSIVGLVLTIVLWFFLKDISEEDKPVQTKKSKNSFKAVLEELKEIMMIKPVWLAGIIGLCTYLPLSIFSEMWAVPFLESFGMTKQEASFGSSLVFIGFAVGGPAWGWFSDYISSRRKPLLIGALGAAICALILVWFTPQSQILLFTLLFLCGFLTSAEILTFAIGYDSCDPHLSATTVAFINMLIMLGGFLVQPLVGIILDLVISKEQSLALYSDYRIALMVLPIGLMLGFISSLVLKETYVSD